MEKALALDGSNLVRRDVVFYLCFLEAFCSDETECCCERFVSSFVGGCLGEGEGGRGGGKALSINTVVPYCSCCLYLCSFVFLLDD